MKGDQDLECLFARSACIKEGRPFRTGELQESQRWIWDDLGKFARDSPPPRPRPSSPPTRAFLPIPSMFLAEVGGEAGAQRAPGAGAAGVRRAKGRARRHASLGDPLRVM